MSKKVIIIIFVSVLLATIGFFVYQNNNPVQIKNQKQNVGQKPAVKNEINVPAVQIETNKGSVGAQGTNDQGMLAVCVDKCGDGICQKTDPNCDKNSTCVCPETKEECPKDCK